MKKKIKKNMKMKMKSTRYRKNSFSKILAITSYLLIVAFYKTTLKISFSLLIQKTKKKKKNKFEFTRCLRNYILQAITLSKTKIVKAKI